MLTPEEVFEELARTYSMGHRYVPPVSSPEAAHLAYVKHAAQAMIATYKSASKTQIEIHFDFLSSGKFNAFATLHDGVGYIAATRGAVLLPVDLFNRLSASPLTLHDVGISALEYPQRDEELFDDLDALIAMRQKAGRSQRAARPVDDVRYSFSHLCAHYAFDFIVAHELVHIYSGHLGFYNEGFGVPLIAEATEILKCPPEQMLTLQAMEMDADSGALTATLRTAVMTGPERGNLEELKEIIATPEQRLFLWCFSNHCLFYLWGLATELDSFHTMSHPPMGMRFALAMINAGEVINVDFPDLAPRFREIATAAQKAARISILITGGREFAEKLASFSQEITDRRIYEHYEKVALHLAKMRPLLEKHALYPRVTAT